VTSTRDDPTFGWDGHLLHLHRTEDEREVGLATWVRRGLERDAKVIYTEATEGPRHRALTAVLRYYGVDVSAALAEGRLQLLPLAEFYPATGHRELVEQALAEGFSAVRFTAEARYALTGLSVATYNAIEHAMDELCRTHPVSALCQYDERDLTGERLPEVVGSHVTGVRHRIMATAGTPGFLALAGELDVSNDELVASTLDAATGTASGTFRLDLSGVVFIDASGCRALAVGTQAFRRRGGRLRVTGAQRRVAHVLRLVAFDRMAGVELIGAPR